MEIAAIFRGDHGRLVSGIACQTPENARQFRHKSCLAQRKRRPGFLRPAIVAWTCNNRLATQDSAQTDITSILCGDRCRVSLPKACEIPWDFQQKNRDKKKIADWDPFPGKMPAKTQVSDSQNGPILRETGGKTAANGAKHRVGRHQPMQQPVPGPPARSGRMRRSNGSLR